MTNHFINDLYKQSFCSLLFHKHGDDPIGSAGFYTSFLFVEVPLPWSHKVQESESFPSGLAEVLTRCTDQGRPFRLQAFSSDSCRSAAGFVRLFYFSRPTITKDPFYQSSSYNKLEYVIPMDRLNELVESILMGSIEQIDTWQSYKQLTADVREIFVCTHGAHDLCCGRFGHSSYQWLDQQCDAQHIRVWRTSHIGGHRYAPTLIDMPEGRYWAYMTPDVLPHLLQRQSSFTEIVDHYRGWSMLTAFEQVAERKLFSQYGWDWIQFHKEFKSQMIDDSTAIVTITFSSPNLEIKGVFETEVYISDTITLGGCGSEPVHSKQYDTRPVQSSKANSE